MQPLGYLQALSVSLLLVIIPAIGTAAKADPTSTATTKETGLYSIGARFGTSFRGEDTDQTDIFVARKLPWSWELSPDWNLGTSGELDLSILQHDDEEDGGIDLNRSGPVVTGSIGSSCCQGSAPASWKTSISAISITAVPSSFSSMPGPGCASPLALFGLPLFAYVQWQHLRQEPEPQPEHGGVAVHLLRQERIPARTSPRPSDGRGEKDLDL